jgi:hypothetical protein
MQSALRNHIIVLLPILPFSSGVPPVVPTVGAFELPSPLTSTSSTFDGASCNSYPVRGPELENIVLFSELRTLAMIDFGLLFS